MKKTSILIPFIIAFFHFKTFKAWSYGTHLNSSKILHSKEYDISGFSQFFSDDRDGSLAAFTVDLPFSPETNWRFYAGAGSFDYAFGVQLKWVPTQQIKKNHFSLGFTFGADYGGDDGRGDDDFGFLITRITPFIGHEFRWEAGLFEPYFALPIGSVFVNAHSKLYYQITAGSHIKFYDLKYMRFSVEGGFNTKNAESYLALMATIQLTQK